MEIEVGPAPLHPGRSEEPETEGSSGSETAVTTGCFGLRSPERIPRRRRWNFLCFSLDREALSWLVRVVFAYVLGIYCMAMMAYLITTGGQEFHISLYFGLFTFVVGYFLGNPAKLKALNGAATD